MVSAEESRATRQWLQKQFRTSGLQMDSAALAHLTEWIQDKDDPEHYTFALMDEASRGNIRRITFQTLLALLGALGGRHSKANAIQVISAFETPFVQYDSVRKQFHECKGEDVLFGPPLSKVQLYTNRYHLVHQRLRRNPLFRSVQWTGMPGHASAECELTELKALLGQIGTVRCILGFLSQPQEGQFAIEDLSARVPVDLVDAVRTPGLFTENSIVVAEGSLQANGTFKATALGMPPPEPRAGGTEALQGLETFGGAALDAKTAEEWDVVHENDALVTLSDVWLDDGAVLAKLGGILKKIAADLEAGVPTASVLVLVGNFLSPTAYAQSVAGQGVCVGSALFSGGLLGKLRRGIDALGRLLSRFPVVTEHCQFVLVPGPDDPGPARHTLPHPGLPASLFEGIRAGGVRVELASNPCRLRFGSREVVVCRAEFLRLLRGMAILSPLPGSSAFEHVAASLVQQAHLMPLPLEIQPVYWEFDRALWLHPLPHTLILADSAAAAHVGFEGCTCINPGALANGMFVNLLPIQNKAEILESPVATDDDM